MQPVRWIILAVVVALHFSMKAPVWDLLARIDIAGGSTGFHRANLINQAISHADEWWLIGSTVGSAHWGYDTADVTNEYLVNCLHGGVLQLVLFVGMISLCFRDVGRTLRAAKGNSNQRGNSYQTHLAWAMGVSLFIHATSFIAVSYFGQINMIWYMLLAMIVSLSPTNSRLRAAMRNGGRQTATAKSRQMQTAISTRPARTPRPARPPRPPRGSSPSEPNVNPA
jgi:hypothetical protein